METIKLDLIPGKKLQSLHASQYDNETGKRLELCENRVPFELDGAETLSIIVRKVDNTLVSMDIANVFGGKTYVDFLTTEQMCACAGYNFGELRIERNGERLGTGNFYLCVEEAPDEGGIQSQSEINNLARQVHDIVVEELEDNGASETGYDNTESGLEATNVQNAIDEVNTKIENIPSVDAYTKEQSDEKYATKTELSDKADVSAIPTKTSQLQNDSSFAEIDDSSTANNKVWSASRLSIISNSLNDLQNYDLSNLTDGKYIDTTNGTEKTNASYLCTGFIELNGASKIEFNALFRIATVGLAFYSTNSAGGYISGVDNDGGTVGDIKKITVPNGAKYFRTSCLKSQYNLGNYPYVKIIDLSGVLKSVFNEVQGKVSSDDLAALVEYKTSSQLLDKSQFIDGKILDTTADVSTPEDMSDNADYTVTNIIELTWEATEGNRIFETNLPTGTFKALGYKLKNGQYVRSGNVSSTAVLGDHYTFSMPEVNVKMRLSLNHTLINPNNIIITKAGEWTTDARYGADMAVLKSSTVYDDNLSEDLKESIYPTNPCNYKGDSARTFKKILCIGDSLTEGAFNYGSGGASSFIDTTLSYPSFLKALTGRDTFNAGDAGQSTKTWWELHQNDDLSGYDACIIELGLNDVAGQPSVQCTSQERIEAVGHIISKLKSENTGIKIFISTLLNTFQGSNHKAVNEDLRDIVESNADCYLLDVSVYGTLTKNLPDRYIHLTAKGYEKMAKDYFNYISFLIDNDNNNEFAFIQYIGTNYETS